MEHISISTVINFLFLLFFDFNKVTLSNIN